MSQENQEKLTSSLEQLVNDDCFKKVFISSIHEIKISWKRIILLLTITICLSPLFVYIGYSDETIIKFLSIVELSNNIIIAFLGIVITGYALFQALTSGETLKKLLLVNVKQRSMFQKYNHFFFALCIMYITIILINFLILSIFRTLPPEWEITFIYNSINNVIASVLVGMYFIVNLNAIIEIKVSYIISINVLLLMLLQKHLI